MSRAQRANNVASLAQKQVEIFDFDGFWEKVIHIESTMPRRLRLSRRKKR